MQERGWQPRWFAKDKGSDAYRTFCWRVLQRIKEVKDNSRKKKPFKQ
jgi:hypothetical protein